MGKIVATVLAIFVGLIILVGPAAATSHENCEESSSGLICLNIEDGVATISIGDRPPITFEAQNTIRERIREIPGPTITVPGPRITLPGPTVTVPGPRITPPRPTVTVPGPRVTVTNQGPTVTAPGPVRTVNREVQGPTVTVTESVPVPTVTKTITATPQPTGQPTKPSDTIEVAPHTPAPPTDQIIITRTRAATVSIGLVILGMVLTVVGMAYIYRRGVQEGERRDTNFLKWLRSEAFKR